MTESYLGVVSNGSYGLDTVGLDVESATGLTSKQNVVAGVLTEPFYLGQFGLKPSNTTIVNGTTSFMQQLKYDKLIPSLSYGYTAGALYSKSHFGQGSAFEAHIVFQSNSQSWEALRLEAMTPRASFHPPQASHFLEMTPKA